MRAAALLLLLLGPALGGAEPVSRSVPTPERQAQLLRMLRQDCGSCHGMRLSGGLGPALTPEALKDKPWQSLSATIFHGRPGTPMPPWNSMLSSSESDWLALQLLQPELPTEQAQGSRRQP